MIAVEGGNTSLTCRAIGKPTPIIYWTFNGDEIPSDSRIVTTSIDGEGTLSISNIQASENGTWGCEALNVKGSVESFNTCQLWIKRKHIPIKIRFNQTNFACSRQQSLSGFLLQR